MRDVLDNEWIMAFQRIRHNSRNKIYRLVNPWDLKLSRISNTWRKFNHQTDGRGQKKDMPKKQYQSIDERLRDCLKYSLDKRRIKGWKQTLETIRTGWRDRGRRIRGGSFS